MIEINLGKNIIKKPRTTHPPDNIDYSKLKYFKSIVKYDKHLVREYRRANVYKMDECKEIIERVFKIIGDKLVERDEVNIDDFGIFKVVKIYAGSVTVHFRPCARLMARMNPENKLFVFNALKDRKVMSLDFDAALPEEPKKKVTRNRKKTTVKAKDVDVNKIVERLEKAKYCSWRKR